MTGVYATSEMVYRLPVRVRKLHQDYLQKLKRVWDVEIAKVDFIYCNLEGTAVSRVGRHNCR